MSYPADLKYTNDHEWVKIDGATAKVGITDYAQKQLGDVVYLELPQVTEVHSALVQNPETVNKDPHASWMIALKVTGGQDGLLDAGAYTDLTK